MIGTSRYTGAIAGAARDAHIAAQTLGNVQTDSCADLDTACAMATDDAMDIAGGPAGIAAQAPTLNPQMRAIYGSGA